MGVPQYGTPPPGYGYQPGYGSAGQLPPVDLGKRVIAGIIDWAISFGIYIVIGIIPAILLAAIRLGALTPLVWLAGLAAAFLYKPYFEATKDGQAIGKKMQGIKVVKEDGSACDWGAALLRHIPLYLIGLIEFIILLVKADRVRLGDMLGKTRVVDVAAAGAVVGGYAQAGYAPQQPAVPPPPQQPAVPPPPQQPAVPPPAPPAPPPSQVPPAPPPQG